MVSSNCMIFWFLFIEMNESLKSNLIVLCDLFIKEELIYYKVDQFSGVKIPGIQIASPI